MKDKLLPKKKIPIAKPFFDEKEAEAVAKVLSSGWLVQGPKVREFEKLFEEFQGCNHAVATTSATTALHLALLCVGVKRDDEIIVPAFTHPATANAAMYVGAKLVFADIELPDFNIDTTEIEKKVTQKTKAIIPVHLFGLPAKMDPIMEMAKHFGSSVVEDAACGQGSVYKGRKAGNMGDCGAFSFHPRKSITTGEGGMLTTNSEEIATLSKILRSHGESLSDELRHQAENVAYPEFVKVGFNYRMTDIQAAIGVEQMKKFPHLLGERRRIAFLYNELLSDLEKKEYLLLPPRRDEIIHSYQSYVILLKEKVKMERDSLSNTLHKRGVVTRKGTYHIPGTKYYRESLGLMKGEFPNSETAEGRSLALPLYVGMDDEDVHFVVENLQELITRE